MISKFLINQCAKLPLSIIIIGIENGGDLGDAGNNWEIMKKIEN